MRLAITCCDLVFAWGVPSYDHPHFDSICVEHCARLIPVPWGGAELPWRAWAVHADQTHNRKIDHELPDAAAVHQFAGAFPCARASQGFRRRFHRERQETHQLSRQMQQKRRMIRGLIYEAKLPPKKVHWQRGITIEEMERALAIAKQAAEAKRERRQRANFASCDPFASETRRGRNVQILRSVVLLFWLQRLVLRWREPLPSLRW